MAEQFADDGDFFGATAVPGAAGDLGGAAQGGGFSLDLTADDMSGPIEYKKIPVGTWLHTEVYEVIPGQAKSDANYGKPNYRVTLRIAEESAEWGKGRKFNVFCNLWGGAFFTAYAVLNAVGKAPTKESAAKGSFFDAAFEEEFPEGLRVGPDRIFTPTKDIPKGAYVLPAPSQLKGLKLMAKVTHYSVSQGPNRNKKYNSEEQALAANPLETRAWANVDQFLSHEAYEEMLAKAAKAAEGGGFK